MMVKPQVIVIVKREFKAALEMERKACQPVQTQKSTIVWEAGPDKSI